VAQTPQLDLKLSVDLEPMRRVVDSLVETAEIYEIFGDVSAEIRRAREKHGTQHHIEMGTGREASYLEQLDHAAVELKLYTDDDYTLDCLDNAQLEQCAKHVCQETGDTWVKILGEEFFEAVATDDPDELDAELVQTIAMAVSMLQAHRRQQDPKA
jgi:hypothetical protein